MMKHKPQTLSQQARWFMGMVYSSIFTFLAFFLVACTQIGGTGSPQGNGQGYGGKTDPSGRMVAFDNTRPRCTFKQQSLSRYQISCVAVVIDPFGSEAVAQSISNGIGLNWLEPTGLEGSTFNVLSCENGTDHLSQFCEVSLQTPQLAKVQMGLVTTEVSTQRTNTETEVLLLPFSMVSTGNIPQFRSYEPGAKSESALGFQRLNSNPTNVALKDIRSLCFQGKRLFFSTTDLIYVIENEALSVYAGSPSRSATQEFSHRTRVTLGSTHPKITGSPYGSNLACDANKIYFADTGNSRILVFQDSGPVSLVAETPMPQGLALGTDGSLYFSDGLNHTVSRRDPEGKTEIVAGKNKSSGFSGDGGPAIEAHLKFPCGLARSTDGSLLIADMANNRIRKIDSAGNITTFGNVSTPYGIALFGNAVAVTSLTDNKISVGSGTQWSAWFSQPGLRDLAVSPSLELAFAESSTQTVRKIAAAGDNAVLLAGALPTQRLPNSLQEEALSIRLPLVTGVALDVNGSVIIADQLQSAIRRVDSKAQQVTLLAGAENKPSPFSQPSLAISSKIGTPYGVALGSEGTLYFSDSYIHRIARIDPMIGFVHIFGPEIWASGITVGPNDALYATDIRYHSIEKVVSGELQRLAGTGVAGFSGDGGIATAAQLSKPLGVAVDSTGQIFIADSGNHRIRKVSMDGKIETIAGTGIAGFSGDGGLAISAQFNEPWGIAVDEKGNLYIADYQNARLRVLTPSANGYLTSTLVGGETPKDCAGALSRHLSSDDLENQVRASLAQLCVGKPTSVSVRNRCGESSGKLTIVYAQSFSTYSNVVKIERPCLE